MEVLKLCRDCKHSVWPDPIAALYGQMTYIEPMCGHPSAEVDLVTGDLKHSCKLAREGMDIGALGKRLVCGRDAQFFEERPPQIVGAVVKMTREEVAKIYPPRRSKFKQWFGG